MKEIEPGCRAVIVGDVIPPLANGVIVTISHRDPEWNSFWVVEEPMQAYGYEDGSIPEKYLQRIDDYDGNEKTSWDKLVDLDGNSIWNPNKTLIEA